VKRREVIRKLAYTVPAGIALPHLISCESELEGSAFTGNVIVIGAGAAGMHAAHLLNRSSINVQILEASGVSGGRIRYLQGFSDFPLELGTDEIYGNDNIWYEIVSSAGVTVKERVLLSRYVLDGTVGTAEEFQNDVDFQIAQGFKNEIVNYQGPDISVNNGISAAGIKSRVHHILNGEIGNKYGTSNERLGMRGVSEQQNIFQGGPGIYIVEGQSFITVINSAFSDILSKIVYNTPVTSINYSGEKVEVMDSNGGVHTADKVVITVPVSILKDNDISFTPSLPGTKTNAIQNIGMDAGMKFALSFDANFWGDNTTSIISDGIVPRYYAPGIGRSSSNSVLAAYVMGDQAEFLKDFEEGQIYETMLDELDRIYDGNASRLVSRDIDENVLGVVMNWTKEPYIRGAYSYPKVGSTLARETLALPVQNKLFFAGEATGLRGDFGMVQGALSSAERVHEEIIAAIAEDLASS